MALAAELGGIGLDPAMAQGVLDLLTSKGLLGDFVQPAPPPMMEAQPPQIDPETGKYPPPPEIPDEPSIPENIHLNVIEFIEDMAGLRLKGSDLIVRRARELLTKIGGNEQ